MACTAVSTWPIMLRPPTSWRTFMVFDFIRVPPPAARTMTVRSLDMPPTLVPDTAGAVPGRRPVLAVDHDLTPCEGDGIRNGADTVVERALGCPDAQGQRVTQPAVGDVEPEGVVAGLGDDGAGRADDGDVAPTGQG